MDERILMKRRAVLAGLGALAATPAFAQEGAQMMPPPEMSGPGQRPPLAAGIVRLEMRTREGAIIIDLAADKAPLTTANFLRYVDLKRFDGATIYRTVRVVGYPNRGLLQGGARFVPDKPIKPVAHEPTTKTGLSHKDGTISMARSKPGTATSDFFFCLGDTPSFDADPSAPGDNQGFAAFGQVVEGMDIVRRIHAMPTSDKAQVASMRGEMLERPVPILNVKRLNK